MMFDFPNTPTTGQQFTPAGGPTYQWNGTGWTLVGAPTAGMLAQTVFTYTGSTQTYTPTPGMQTAIIECVGGGASGASGNGGSAGDCISPGGGSGGYSRKFVTAGTGLNGVGTSQVVTIGAGGIANTPSGTAATVTPGNAGGNTSVGSLCVANGGPVAGTSGGAGASYAGGAGAASGTGDIAAAGAPGEGGGNLATGNAFALGGGGSSIFGGGARPAAFPAGGATTAGNNASSYGSGGGGSMAFATTAGATGGAGSPGIVIITEYANVAVGSTSGPAKPGELTGLGLTWSSATSLQIAAGCACSDDFSTIMITQGIASKLIKTAWSAGSGGGSLDTGAIAASTWYHVFLIENVSSGAVDVLTSVSVATPTLPSGYTKQRRIGSIKTDASSNMLNFIQVGDEFAWVAPATWDTANNLGIAASSGTTLTVNTPPGIRTIVVLNTFASNPSAGTNILIRVMDMTISAPFFNLSAISGNSLSSQLRLPTNTSQQINAVASPAISSGFYAGTQGWIDNRGK